MPKKRGLEIPSFQKLSPESSNRVAALQSCVCLSPRAMRSRRKSWCSPRGTHRWDCKADVGRLVAIDAAHDFEIHRSMPVSILHIAKPNLPMSTGKLQKQLGVRTRPGRPGVRGGNGLAYRRRRCSGL